jgi:hypothetical protein
MNQDGSIIIIEAGKEVKFAIVLREAIWSNFYTPNISFSFPSSLGSLNYNLQGPWNLVNWENPLSTTHLKPRKNDTVRNVARSAILLHSIRLGRC